MKKISHLALLVACTLAGAASLVAQDQRFSEFYNSPLLLNPALTGLFVEDVRLTAQYRNQWNTVTIPFQTMAASYDMSLLKGSLGDDFVGVGLQLMNDVAGDGNFRNTQALVSFSYSKALTGMANQYLTAGAQYGISQRAVNTASLLFDSQFDGATLNQNIPSGEAINRPNFLYTDLSAGLAWYYVPDERSSYYLGASVAHLNSPNMSFYEGVENRLSRRVTVHAGFQFPIGSSVSLIPRAVIFRQGGFSEFNFGGLLKFEVHPDYGANYGQSAFYVGTMHRLNDAQIILVRFDYNNIGISAMYDINISDLATASRGNGGFELGLSYRAWLFDSQGLGGPQGCPVW